MSYRIVGRSVVKVAKGSSVKVQPELKVNVLGEWSAQRKGSNATVEECGA
jgi:hypothetical protein